MTTKNQKPLIQIYSSARCPYCVWAKNFFNDKKLAYEELRIDLDQQNLDTMVTKTGKRSVPQIFIGDRHVGGYQDLLRQYQEGSLDKIFAEAKS